jgi:hypothetical protein
MNRWAKNGVLDRVFEQLQLEQIVRIRIEAVWRMEITEEQYARIKDSLPLQRGNVSLSNLQVLNAILYVAEQGCKWRGHFTGFLFD